MNSINRIIRNTPHTFGVRSENMFPLITLRPEVPSQPYMVFHSSGRFSAMTDHPSVALNECRRPYPRTCMHLVWKGEKLTIPMKVEDSLDRTGSTTDAMCAVAMRYSMDSTYYQIHYLE
ncbi:hypothetical protein A0H81_06030 [Grifola frondosa]|uniref:Uncharacterized protein n=1 Tax=Grifola frondosa TaxID=5627 RepID=A0A1C7MBG3_GRIFR|nr:hypothetical protein A0H81_06030 [Grifola frondosa]